jgi:hypothetical protein
MSRTLRAAFPHSPLEWKRSPNAVVLVAHRGCGSLSIRRALKRLRATGANLVGSSLVR